MQVFTVAVTLCLSFVALSFQQPPGVPPKGHNQQFQQQQQQQQPAAQGHHEAGGHGHGHGQGLHFSSEVHNADHILEHLQNVVATKKKEEMTEEELEFHYFKLHDYDNNNKLDGVEIGKALTHFHDDHVKVNQELGLGQQEKVLGSQEPMLEITIDRLLRDDDADGDGYISYTEYRISNRRYHKKSDS